MAALERIYLSALKGVIVVLFAALVVAGFYQVVSRYLLGTTPAWTEEVARYLAIWVVLLTCALAIELRAHIAVDLVPKLLPRLAQLLLTSLCWACIFGFLLVFLIQSYSLLSLVKRQMTPGLRIPMAYVYAILPLSGTCMLISSARAVWRFVRHDIPGLPEEEQSLSEIP